MINNNYKMTPAMFDIWMRLLTRVPDSVIWLFVTHPDAPDNLRKHAQDRGVDPKRLVFASHKPLEQHLSRIRQADLFLDTLPYNAHTTTSDALWVGLPVVTCAGQAFAARVAGSLLSAVGLPELVTDSLAAYEALAFELATRPERMKALRDKLGSTRAGAPLFDTPRFTRSIEQAFAAMWDRAVKGLPADHIDVNPPLNSAKPRK